MGQPSSGEWLEKALLDLCGKIETGLDLDADVISGLVSYCELAPPEDASEYLNNIIGQDAGQSVIQEYLKKRGYVDPSSTISTVQHSALRAYVKPPADEGFSGATKKPTRHSKEGASSGNKCVRSENGPSDSGDVPKGSSSIPKKKKAGKAVSLAEAAKGSVVFQQGKPCSCQARRHKLISNCLSCGKIVCEQEGEGPCSFCGALVLKEGSTYAGLEDAVVPLSDKEAAAEAFAKRLVDYDRNSAARTMVFDDQSDYYEIESNNWLSKEEKDLMLMKQKEMKEAEEKRKNKVIVTFDLLGRKVIVNQDEASELESECRILRAREGELNRIKPNPTILLQPIFVETATGRDPNKAKQRKPANGLCLEISGRVQHDASDLRVVSSRKAGSSDGTTLHTPSANSASHNEADNYECSLDYN